VSEIQSELATILAELTSKIQTLLDKQEELGENIAKIKEAVYNPDSGLYARLNRLDARILTLESWKANNTRLLWIVVTVSAGLVATSLWQLIF
jgi:chromosome segregation ATPase